MHKGSSKNPSNGSSRCQVVTPACGTFSTVSIQGSTSGMNGIVTNSKIRDMVDAYATAPRPSLVNMATNGAPATTESSANAIVACAAKPNACSVSPVSRGTRTKLARSTPMVGSALPFSGATADRSVVVNPAALNKLAVTTATTATAGTAQNVTVTAQDQFANTITGYTASSMKREYAIHSASGMLTTTASRYPTTISCVVTQMLALTGSSRFISSALGAGDAGLVIAGERRLIPYRMIWRCISGDGWPGRGSAACSGHRGQNGGAGQIILEGMTTSRAPPGTLAIRGPADQGATR